MRPAPAFSEAPPLVSRARVAVGNSSLDPCLARGPGAAIMQLAETLPAEETLPMTRFATWLSLTFALVIAVVARAEVKRPAPPKDYDVSLRFQIRAPLPGWYDRYDEMVAELKKFGFAPAARP